MSLLKWLLGNRVETPVEQPVVDTMAGITALANLDGRWTLLFRHLRKMGATVFEIGETGELHPSPLMIGYLGTYTDWRAPLEALHNAGLIRVEFTDTHVKIFRTPLTDPVQHTLNDTLAA